MGGQSEVGLHLFAYFRMRLFFIVFGPADPLWMTVRPPEKPIPTHYIYKLIASH